MADLLRQQFMPVVDVQGSRVEFAGPRVIVTAEAAQAIGLAIHELATNALKYGALSVSSGTVRISWTVDDEEPAKRLLVLSWAEKDGPHIVPPTRQGFGRLVIGEMIERSLNAKVVLEFDPRGVKWTASILATNVVVDVQTGYE